LAGERLNTDNTDEPIEGGVKDETTADLRGWRGLRASRERLNTDDTDEPIEGGVRQGDRGFARMARMKSQDFCFDLLLLFFSLS
jgi:hypothetical protein